MKTHWKYFNSYISEIYFSWAQSLGPFKYKTETCDIFFEGAMVFNATFNNISFTSWRSFFFFLVEETGVPRENHRPAASHWQTLSHNFVSSIPRLSGIRTNNVSGDMHWLHKSNYHTITTAPRMDSPETLATLGTQDEDRQKTTQKTKK